MSIDPDVRLLNNLAQQAEKYNAVCPICISLDEAQQLRELAGHLERFPRATLTALQFMDDQIATQTRVQVG